MKPALGEKIKLKVTLEGKPDDGEAIFGIAWEEDLDEIKGKKNLDDRSMTIETCEKWQNLETTIKSNKATIKADSVVSHDAWRGNTNALEIFACIRAEYKFITEVGCRKVSSRFGTHGIDHIFKKGAETYIVESKTVSDLTVVSPAITRREHNAVLRRLGSGRKVDTGGIIVSAGQMTKSWVNLCLVQLQQNDSSVSKETKWEVDKIMKNMHEGNQPHRVLNIYGGLDWNANGAYEELRSRSTQISSKYIKGTSERSDREDLLLLDGKWETHDPQKGKFYLLPGKYTLRLMAAGQWVVEKKNIKTVVHADKPFKNEEFFLLDRLTKNQRKELGLPNEEELQQSVKNMDNETSDLLSG